VQHKKNKRIFSKLLRFWIAVKDSTTVVRAIALHCDNLEEIRVKIKSKNFSHPTPNPVALSLKVLILREILFHLCSILVAFSLNRVARFQFCVSQSESNESQIIQKCEVSQ
jgi:hypothetical protein